MAINITDPIHLAHLRDLPTGYLYDLLADYPDVDAESLYWVLQERGLTREEIDRKVESRRSRPWARPHKLWAAARWLSFFNVLIIAYFNLSGFYDLLHGDHELRILLLVLSFGCVLCGFYIGFKLSTHLYQGAEAMLYCGFPVVVGKVDLKSGDEILTDKKIMIMLMSVNAAIGVNLALFPLILIYFMIR